MPSPAITSRRLLANVITVIVMLVALRAHIVAAPVRTVAPEAKKRVVFGQRKTRCVEGSANKDPIHLPLLLPCHQLTQLSANNITGGPHSQNPIHSLVRVVVEPLLH
ncbi:uncharacterized protein UTRI_04007 [Ustilago trichophora]|uniref:Uncharacterized protein n=1 Tax=Ustilago trichophora TaxID=86804 RepID=A0A5C3E7I0_9BASI|nr:uncharacterized protein UTRI_04007 [Ustilago trichophora]